MFRRMGMKTFHTDEFSSSNLEFLQGFFDCKTELNDLSRIDVLLYLADGETIFVLFGPIERTLPIFSIHLNSQNRKQWVSFFPCCVSNVYLMVF